LRPPQILCVSFSPLSADSRVLRQIRVLQEHGDVTTVGYGPAPDGVTRHIEVPENASSLPETPLGVARLALRRHEAVELRSPGEKAVRRPTVEAGPYDLVVANDARALPLAFAAAGGAPVLADMHEWAREERATILIWRLLVGPYMEAVCQKYLPRTAAVTSVSAGLAGLYRDRYGVDARVVRNAPDFQDLEPSPVAPETIRLVHSGTADPDRNIMEVIEAVDRLGDRFTLDLYLLRVPGGHLDALTRRAASSPRISVHPPVPPQTLPHVLNQYDLGVFIYPVRNVGKLYYLPNKFFDFVQARLGLVFSPAPEIEALIGQYGLGVITKDTSADALVEALRDITADEVAGFKNAADRSARALSSEPEMATQGELVARLLAERS
jgi:glycosyltransferase involved in cell wall biosynthesis